MSAQLPHSKAARLLAALALTFCLGLALAAGTSKPASADASQWTRSQSNWGNSSGWNRHWRGNQFGNRSQVIIGGGSGVIITRPNFVIGNSGFIVRQPGFVVRQPAFIVRQPAFIVRQPAFIVRQPGFVVRNPNFIFAQPQFVLKQKQFFKRHPSLFIGKKPWWHKNWSHKRWKHKRWKHKLQNGMN